MGGFAPGAGGATAANPFPITPGQPFTDPATGASVTSALGIYVGTTGTVIVQRLDQTYVTFTAVPAGFILPVVGVNVSSASTAGNLVGLR